jgi:hypothetical protein
MIDPSPSNADEDEMDKRLLPYMLLNVMKNEKDEEKRIGKLLMLLGEFGYGDEDEATGTVDAVHGEPATKQCYQIGDRKVSKAEFEANYRENAMQSPMWSALRNAAECIHQRDVDAAMNPPDGVSGAGLVLSRFDARRYIEAVDDYGLVLRVPVDAEVRRDYEKWLLNREEVNGQLSDDTLLKLQEVVVRWMLRKK